MKMFYYYLRQDGHPYGCVCLIHDPKTVKFYRGVSVCSPVDQFVKETGRNKARGRALHAMATGGKFDPIRRVEGVPFEFKSEADAILNSKEMEIVKDEV